MYEEENRVKPFIASFQEATENDPEFAEGYVNWGLVLAEEGKYSDAVYEFLSGLSPLERSSKSKSTFPAGRNLHRHQYAGRKILVPWDCGQAQAPW